MESIETWIRVNLSNITVVAVAEGCAHQVAEIDATWWIGTSIQAIGWGSFAESLDNVLHIRIDLSEYRAWPSQSSETER